jgi:hypothetical protein
MGLETGSNERNLETFRRFGFFGAGQRRGAHVSVPKIGSRDGVLCFGGILGTHADLRREIVWGNFNLLFFWSLGGSPRESIEEGGHSCVLGELKCQLGSLIVYHLLT